VKVKPEEAVLAAACAVCCAPLIIAAAPAIAPFLLAGAATAIGAGIATTVRRRADDSDVDTMVATYPTLDHPDPES
jgi:hypothetical protein